MASQVNGSRVEWNPTAARLRELTEKMPNATLTEFGNVVVKARVDSRSTRSTYIVDDSTNSRGQIITRAEYDRVAAIQDAHIAKSHMVVVDGYIGSDPQFRTRARLIMEAANANVAGMQKSSAIVQATSRAPRVDRGPRLRLRGGRRHPGRGRHRDPPAPPALRTAGPDRRARGHGDQAQAGAEGIPRLLPWPGRIPSQVAGLRHASSRATRSRATRHRARRQAPGTSPAASVVNLSVAPVRYVSGGSS